MKADKPLGSERAGGGGDDNLRPVEDVLRNEPLRYLAAEAVATVPSGTPVGAVLELLRRDESRGAVIVVDGERPESAEVVGIFTERDHLDRLAGVPIDLGRPIDDLMTRDPRTVSPEDTFETAVRWMTRGGYRHLPVVGDDGALIGLISTKDVIEYLADFFPVEVYNLPPRLHQNDAISSREGG